MGSGSQCSAVARWAMGALLVALSAGACGEQDAATDTATTNAATDAAAVDTDESQTDGLVLDAAGIDTIVADLSDTGAPKKLQPDPAPTGAMRPNFGELSIHQLDLPMGLVPKLGEAAIIIGPDGTLTLIDIGNTKHGDEVREAVSALNTKWLTPARGYPKKRNALEVEWVVLTHNHGDHMGAAGELLAGGANVGKTALEVTRGVVHRGDVDLGDGANLKRWAELCAALKTAPKDRNYGLCSANSAPPCSEKSLQGVFAATGCPGLRWGRLDDPSDDGAGVPSWLPLGGGARLTLLAANGRCTGQGQTEDKLVFGHKEGNEENGRSLVGIVSWGPFRYHFGGDLTGSGKPGEPDVESLLVKTSGARFWGTDGVDVVHAHHHGRKTSSNMTLVSALAPKDGHGRNVVAGINAAYLGSPATDVVSRFTDAGRLGTGHFWVTKVTVGGHSKGVIEADGEVRLRTFAKGAGYRMQAWGKGSKASEAFAAVRSGALLAQ